MVENDSLPQINLPIKKSGIGLKKISPYWYPYRTMAKGRWFDREILELVSTEFRDRSVEYYRYALESGVTTVNGKIAKPGTIVRNGDMIENIVHRHEPPVTSTPVQILHHDVERDFIVINKPGSIPVHATGRYFKNSLVEILKNDFGFKKVHTVNRLDRLTSGLMIIALSPSRARILTEEFTAGSVRKEYIARVKGEFTAEEVSCEEPLLTVDRQMGLNIVHPEGKHAKTIFKRLHYDPDSDTSVLHCRPLTGRSHQIRVHLQFLGYPIANDPVYSEEKIWGSKLGKGGIDLVPSDERSAPVPPEQHKDSHAEGRHWRETDNTEDSSSSWHRNSFESSSAKRAGKVKKRQGNPAWRTKEESRALTADASGEPPVLLPRETGHDIGMGSPVPLSLEAVRVITRLRNQKDEDEDWSRWRDVIFRAKGALKPLEVDISTLPPNNQLRRQLREDVNSNDDKNNHKPVCETKLPKVDTESDTATEAEAAAVNKSVDNSTPKESPLAKADRAEETLYCPECYLPLHPDPSPEKLYIFLHAIRYTTSLGSFETEMPVWAEPGFTWER